MKLGELAFLANGSIDSGIYLPRAGCLRITIQGTATADGTCQVFFTDLYVPADEYAVGVPVAGVADDPNIFVVEFPTRSAFAGVFLRYTNTDATPGTIRFSADS